MINCAKLAMQFDALLPGAAVPEHTCGRQGFFMLMSMETQSRYWQNELYHTRP